jgi:GH25 family lysozyme M1 (1,4-beta-N-acetylmuramidase)
MQVVQGRQVVPGVDVSNHQRDVNWAFVASAGYRWAAAKATEGIGYRDPFYARNRDGAKANGLVFGAYHWLRPNLDVAAQVGNFITHTGSADGCDFVMLDAEEGGLTGPAISQWCAAVAELTGKPIAIYCGAYTDPKVRPVEWRQYTPWLAAYPAGYEVHPDPATLKPPVNPAPWGRWDIWQYTSSGRVPGVAGNCDVNVADISWFNQFSHPNKELFTVGQYEDLMAAIQDVGSHVKKEGVPPLIDLAADTNRWVKVRNSTDPAEIEKAVREALTDFDVEIVVKPKG